MKKSEIAARLRRLAEWIENGEVSVDEYDFITSASSHSDLMKDDPGYYGTLKIEYWSDSYRQLVEGGAS